MNRRQQPPWVGVVIGIAFIGLGGFFISQGELHMKGGRTLHPQDLEFKLMVGWMIFLGAVMILSSIWSAGRRRL